MEGQHIKFGEKFSKGVINRSLLVTILLVLQVVLLSVVFVLLAGYVHYIYLINLVISLFIVVYIVNRQEAPEFKIAWLAFMCLMPIFGIGYYLFIELSPKQKKIVANSRKVADYSAHLLAQNLAVPESMGTCVPRYIGLINFLQKKGPYPVYNCSGVTYYNDGEKAFEAVKTALRNAKTYIFMEYFVVSPGKLLDEVVGILMERAAAGVEIRLMYDGLCHAKTLSYNFPKQLKEYGIKVHVFEPFSPFLSSDQNYRDHRKMTIVDGEVAFTGGFNLADEYVNFTQPFGHWKDIAARISGEAVRTYAVLFLQNWHLDGLKEKDIWENYLPKTSMPPPVISQVKNDMCGGGFIAPYADSPNVSNEIGETVYIDILNQAKEYVWIMTPYMILGSDVLKAIAYATGRGVDVKIIIPHIPDKKIPFAIAKSYYPELIKAGVKIYEYTPGFIHAKLFVSDDVVATVGSYNLDYRSFYLNYEVGALLVNCPAIKDIRQDYETTLNTCHEISIADYKALPFPTRVLGKILRLFGPLM
jgi:cardiolipin synthase